MTSLAPTVRECHEPAPWHSLRRGRVRHYLSSVVVVVVLGLFSPSAIKTGGAGCATTRVANPPFLGPHR